ncbi:MAG: hypothetical protein R3C14_24015 [Caldilineaceae bacterium]
MILPNFSHPITPAQQQQEVASATKKIIEALTGQAIARTIDVFPQFDKQQPFDPQLTALS